MMTTAAALLGALPLVLEHGTGSRAALPAGRDHRRRPAAQPGADALHDAGDLLWRSSGSGCAAPARRAIVPAECRVNFSALFIRRPVATVLLVARPAAVGLVAYRFLPVAPLPSVDIPTIVVFAGRPGADPETDGRLASPPRWSAARRDRRRVGDHRPAAPADAIVIQFDLDRDIDGAAHDVQAAINAATTDLPSDLPIRPYLPQVQPGRIPVMTIALTSDTLPIGQVYESPTASWRSGSARSTASARSGQRRRQARRARAARPGRAAAAGLSARTSTRPSAPPTSTAPPAASKGRTAPRASP